MYTNVALDYDSAVQTCLLPNAPFFSPCCDVLCCVSTNKAARAVIQKPYWRVFVQTSLIADSSPYDILAVVSHKE